MNAQFEEAPQGGRPLRVLAGPPSPRTLPHSLEAERYVLASCLLDGSETIGRCLQAKLIAKAFYLPAHGIIFGAIVELYRTRPPVSREMLVEELTTRRELEVAGGLAYLVGLGSEAPTTINTAYFIEVVRVRWLLRELVKEATAAVESAYNLTEGLPELLEAQMTKWARMLDYARADQETMEMKAAAGMQRSLAKVAGQVDRTRQLWSGLPIFDKTFGPFDVREEDWFVFLGGLQSSGKSSFARQIAGHNLGQGKKGLVFLLETSIAKYLELGAASSAHVNARYG